MMTTRAAAAIDACSCGEAHPHVLARRTTADGRFVRLWTDGTVTHAAPGDLLIHGLGRPRSKYGVNVRAKAVRLIADEIGCFDLAELPRLIRSAEATYRHTWLTLDHQRHYAMRKVGAAP